MLINVSSTTRSFSKSPCFSTNWCGFGKAVDFVAILLISLQITMAQYIWYPATDGMCFDFPLSLGTNRFRNAGKHGQQDNLTPGTPLTVIFPLLHLLKHHYPHTAVKQYYPQTNVYTNATVQPTLQR